jgi:uncharacterized protein YndB with AHSA1/START domain
MSKAFTLTASIPASPKKVYNAWLDSKEHSLMTGGAPAIINNEVDQPFAAHNAYLWGKNLELVPDKKIVQTWRTTGFKSTDEDSKIEVTLEKSTDGTLLTLTHSKVPDQEIHVEQGWVSHYFEPMTNYFNNKQ